MNAVAAETRAMWNFAPGTELAPGRTAVRLLGGGDRYEAWLGWDDHLAAPVVLKLLRSDTADDERSRRAIAREAAILRSLAHPSIVRCFDADTEGAQPYLVLEFLDGPRLSTLLRRFGPLSAEQLVPLALELASALRYMHNERLVHLDVKPQNVIMGAPPRLIDLSIARHQDRVAELTRSLGTAAYMAPEQADVTQLRTIGPWTDVWGLGATLYEAANGYRPFAKIRSGEAPPQLSHHPTAFHARVPRPVAEIIGLCLSGRAADRPSLAEVYEAFEQLLPDAREIALKRLHRRVR